MNITIDATGVGTAKGGVTRYATMLLTYLLRLYPDDRYRIILRSEIADDHDICKIIDRHEHAARVHINVPPLGPRRDALFYVAPRTYDVFHTLSSYLPLRIHTRSIVTIHDLKYIKYRKYLGRLSGLKHLYMKRVLMHGAHHASHIITVSRSTYQDMMTHFRPSVPMEVIYEAGELDGGGADRSEGAAGGAGGAGKRDASGSSDRAESPVRYFLYVGEQRPHKNIEGLIEAYRQFCAMCAQTRRADRTKLVLVGNVHGSMRRPLAYPEGVEQVDAQDDERLFSLYRDAIALCLVSFYEGFGLPILEAFHAGIPVITSNISSMPEVAGDAGLCVNPYSIEEIASAMYRIYTEHDLRAQLIAHIPQVLRKFCWHDTAVQTHELYKKVAGREARLKTSRAD